jgi:hypothetical protein
MIGPGRRCWVYKERKIKEGEAQLNEWMDGWMRKLRSMKL